MRTILAFIYEGKYTLELDTQMADYHIMAIQMHGDLYLAAKKYNLKGLQALASSKLKLTVDNYL